jgi:ABC-2 type transport system permease protein
VAIMTSYPPLALLGRLLPEALLSSVLTASVLALLARRVWLRALRNYTSASS